MNIRFSMSTNLHQPDCKFLIFQFFVTLVCDFNSSHIDWVYISNSANSNCLAFWEGINKLILLHYQKDPASFYLSSWNTKPNQDLAFFSVALTTACLTGLFWKCFLCHNLDLQLLFHQNLLYPFQADLLSTGAFARSIGVTTLQ